MSEKSRWEFIAGGLVCVLPIANATMGDETLERVFLRVVARARMPAAARIFPVLIGVLGITAELVLALEAVEIPTDVLTALWGTTGGICGAVHDFGFDGARCSGYHFCSLKEYFASGISTQEVLAQCCCVYDGTDSQDH